MNDKLFELLRRADALIFEAYTRGVTPSAGGDVPQLSRDLHNAVEAEKRLRGLQPIPVTLEAFNAIPWQAHRFSDIKAFHEFYEPNMAGGTSAVSLQMSHWRCDVCGLETSIHPDFSNNNKYCVKGTRQALAGYFV